jgi:hypothetical protein
MLKATGISDTDASISITSARCGTTSTVPPAVSTLSASTLPSALAVPAAAATTASAEVLLL